MPRIAQLNLDQINKQIDKIDQLHQRVSELESKFATTTFQVNQVDFQHARQTFNNITFTWTGSSGTLSWTKGWIRDKNALLGTNPVVVQTPSYKNQSGITAAVTHNIGVPAGSLALNASTYYWLGWDVNSNLMYALTDITKLYTQTGMQIICQVFTGTSGQTGTAGGGGSQGGSDLSGTRYKLF